MKDFSVALYPCSQHAARLETWRSADMIPGRGSLRIGLLEPCWAGDECFSDRTFSSAVFQPTVSGDDVPRAVCVAGSKVYRMVWA